VNAGYPAVTTHESEPAGARAFDPILTMRTLRDCILVKSGDNVIDDRCD
jgi:hypothetical protein